MYSPNFYQPEKPSYSKPFFAGLGAVLGLSALILGAAHYFRLPFSAAAINPQINYQGQLLTPSGNPVPDASYDLTFRIYSVDGEPVGDADWLQTKTVTTQDGIFSTVLDVNLDFSSPDGYWLGIQIAPDALEMSPRKKISSVAQAYNANSLIGDGPIEITGHAYIGDQVGIGTQIPNYMLEVIGPALGTTARFSDNVNGTLEIRFPEWNLTDLFADSQDMSLSDQNGEIMRLQGSNVGIGTVTPSTRLHVSLSGGALTDVGDPNVVAVFDNPGDNAANVYVNALTGQTDVNYNFALDGAERGGLRYNVAGDYLTLHNGSVDEVLVIDNGGNVGIGTDDPSSRLQVRSSAGTLSAIWDPNAIAVFDNPGSNAANLHLNARDDQQYENVYFSIDGDMESGIRYNIGNDYLALFVDGDNLNSEQFVLQGNSVGIGDTSPDHRLDVSGGNINVDDGYAYKIDGTDVLAYSAGTSLLVGKGAGISNSGVSNTFLGHWAGSSNTSGTANTFTGYVAGASNVDGYNNSFFGSSAGVNNVSGYSNVFVGVGSGYSNVSGDQNVFIGAGAGSNNAAGHYNSVVGYEAGFGNIGDSNSFFGYQAGRSTTTGIQNIFIGIQAGVSNQDGVNNIAIGALAYSNNVSGQLNIAIGNDAIQDNTTGIQNVAVGH